MMQYNCIGLGYKSKYKGDFENSQNFNEECFCTRLTEDLLLYGLCVGYKGNKISKYVAKHFVVKFLNLIEDTHNAGSQINGILKKTFMSIEDDILNHASSIIDNGNQLESASVLIALNHKNKLHVAYSGCSRALLVTSNDKLHHINQLTDEHNLMNVKEIQRLTELGLDCSHMETSELCGHPFTRCIGGVQLKKFYQNYPLLSKLPSSPWTCEPDVIEPIHMNDSTHMLILLSNNIIYKMADNGSQYDKVNDIIFTKIQQQVQIQPNMNNVAQCLVDEISPFESKKSTQPAHESSCSLIIHNFKNPYLSSTSKKLTLPNLNSLPPLTIDVGNEEPDLSQLNSLQLDFQMPEMFIKKNISRSETIKSVDGMLKSSDKSSQLDLDECGKIAPYVDFSTFYTNSLNADLKNDLKALHDFEILSENILKN